MSATDRQNRLLVAEDWKRIYQTFRNADFQSYDFENLRRVMINYIRENYPEDFNDYIESSEYLALIDLIAFLGQSISFRTDLNARDNFLELAERRESVLRLARLLSYNPKRNIAGSGLLKFSSVSTTQTVIDSNGRNLSGQIVLWNDPANVSWYDQFIKVINAALPSSRQFGNPDDKSTIYGIPTEQYRFQSANTDAPVYSFQKSVDGRTMPFEVVSTIFRNSSDIYEEPPAIGNRLSFIFRNDGKGNASTNTGFFLHFRQGILSQGTFDITQPSTSESIDIDAVNINNTDIWLYRLDQNGLETEYWQQVPSLEGNNIIYNSLKKSVRNIYSAITRAGDRVSLLFSDGTFGNIPRGTFRVYYRTSNGISYTINPKDIRNISIGIPYISNNAQVETLTINLSLQSSVDNSSETESNDSIKSRAPATYYTQNRMITAEDYNISPLSVNQQIIKIKAVNRSSSGISRYFDLVDPTGKYSKTNLFADDGIIYKEEFSDSFKFSYQNRTDIEAIIYNTVIEALKSDTLRDFYYSNFTTVITDSLSVAWYRRTVDTNLCTGYISDIRDPSIAYDTDPIPYKLGSFTSTALRFLTSGALVEFRPPDGYYFDKADENKLVRGTANVKNSATSLWCKVVTVSGDGAAGGDGIFADGTGPVSFNDIIPQGAIIYQIIPSWRTTIDNNTVSTMIDLIFANKPFGLRYDIQSRTWKIIFEVNLNLNNRFSLGKQGDNSNQQLDSSWLLLFTTDTEFYTVKSRLLRYIFESENQVRFYFDASDKIYDTRNNTTVKDKIRILNINTQPDSIVPFTIDRDWEVSEEFKGLDGYVDTKKIQVTFSDTDDDGVVDTPTLFEEIVAPTIATINKKIILEKYEISVGQEDYRWVDNSDQKVVFTPSLNSFTNLAVIADGQYVYSEDTDTVYKFSLASATFEITTDYKVYIGRAGLKFQYIHNADYESRIDPGITNLIDIYVLTKQYDQNFRQWLNGSLDTEPLPPSQDTLFSIMSIDLNKIKSISDEIVYHPVKYKILFGEKATQDVQATFKIVKNSELVISDNDIKSSALSAINEFFSLENWEFGETFYFTELATYVMNRLSPYAVNFVIVPKQAGLTFGALYEIKCEKDQIFVNGGTVSDIEVITAVTASKLKASGAIIASRTATGQQIITSAGIED